MDKKLEFNLNYLIGTNFNKPLKAEDFKESKNIFSIFDLDKDGKINKEEANNIFQQLMNYSEKNTSDTRENAYAILDESEGESLINEGQNAAGKTFAELGATVAEMFKFLNTFLSKVEQSTAEESESGVTPSESGDVLSGASEQEDVLTPEQEAIARELSNIPQRGKEQFSKEDCAMLAKLTPEELEKAKKLLYIESREKQLSAEDIMMIVTQCGGKFTVIEENAQRLDEFLLLKNSAGEELSGSDIVILMSLPSDKIDSAIELLTLKNRVEHPLSTEDIVNIINVGSDALLDFVKSNPHVTEFDKSSSLSGYWISVKDNAQNVTYRFIQGQQYPEEIVEEKLEDGTIKRSITNKNLNIKQTVILQNKDAMNPQRIETQHLSQDGTVAYTEVMEQGINPGTPDVYTIDSKGNKTYLQQTIIDEQTGVQTTVKRFADDNGNLTEFSYSAISDNEYNLDYKITDKAGNVIFTRQSKVAKVGDNLYEYTKDDKTYTVETKDDKVIITDKSDNKSYTINYSDFIDNENNPDIFKQNILRIPADILIFLSKNPLSLSYGTKVKDNQGLCRVQEKAIDIGTITIAKCENELNNAFITILVHEVGHYINNPDLSDDNKDILSMNEDFLKVYRQELEDFKNNHSAEEQMFILQFNGIGYDKKSAETQLKRSSDETFAESNMITNTNSKSWTSARSYYLQRYFPRTIAFAQRLLQERIQP